MKMRTILSFCCWVLLGATVSSCAKQIPYSFYDDYWRTNAQYYKEDAAGVRDSLIGFLGRAEMNATAVQSEKRLNGQLIVGEAWLRLAAICQFEGNTRTAEYAMTRAIGHFDRLESFAADAGYEKDKPAALMLFLQREDALHPPNWRQERGNPQKQIRRNGGTDEAVPKQKASALRASSP